MPAGGDAIAAADVVVDHPEIVNADVGELRTAGDLTDGPNTGRRCLQPFIRLDIAVIPELDPREFEPDAAGIRSAAGGHE